jgi:hypothetical protein
MKKIQNYRHQMFFFVFVKPELIMKNKIIVFDFGEEYR